MGWKATRKPRSNNARGTIAQAGNRARGTVAGLSPNAEQGVRYGWSCPRYGPALGCVRLPTRSHPGWAKSPDLPPHPGACGRPHDLLTGLLRLGK